MFLQQYEDFSVVIGQCLEDAFVKKRQQITYHPAPGCMNNVTVNVSVTINAAIDISLSMPSYGRSG